MDVKSMKDLDCALRVHEQGQYKVASVAVGVSATNRVLRNKLSGLTSLTSLHLICTKVKDVSPLSGLISLTYLNLSYSKVTNVSPLSGSRRKRECPCRTRDEINLLDAFCLVSVP